MFVRFKYFSTHLVFGVVIGVIAGLVSAAFLASLNWATTTRNLNGWLIFSLPLIGLAIGLAYTFVGNDVAHGSNLVLEEIHEPNAGVPRRMAPLVFIASVITHLAGGSTGREGAAMQITASLTDGISRLFHPNLETRRILLITAIAGSFGAIIGVPIAGMVFALEVQEIGRIRYEALVPALIASVVGDRVVRKIGIHHLSVARLDNVDMTFTLVWKIVIASAAFAAVSILFVAATHRLHTVTRRFITWQPLRPFIGGVILLALTALVGTRIYLGLSVDLVESALAGAVGISAVAWAWKLIFTTVSLGTGFIGGEVTPLFVIGALSGAQVAHLLNAPVPLFAALGLLATFAAAANTPIACIVIGVEYFGTGALVPIAFACVLAFAMSGHGGIYHSQRNALRRY
ncbi:MAG: chloride channel protein [Ilumatobacteraceae bacterium]